MILYPAIDLKDGKAVRLLRGDMDKSTVFNNCPTDQALSFVNQRCQWLHLVDLNGAFEGKPVNADAIEAIIKRCNIPISQEQEGKRQLLEETLQFTQAPEVHSCKPN